MLQSDVGMSYVKDSNGISQRSGSLDNMNASLQQFNGYPLTGVTAQYISSQPTAVISQSICELTNVVSQISRHRSDSTQATFRPSPNVQVTQALSNRPIAAVSQSSRSHSGSRMMSDRMPFVPVAIMYSGAGQDAANGRTKTTSDVQNNHRVVMTELNTSTTTKLSNDTKSTSNSFPVHIRQSLGPTMKPNPQVLNIDSSPVRRKIDSLTSSDRVDGVRSIPSHSIDPDGLRNRANIPRPLRKRSSFDVHENIPATLLDINRQPMNIGDKSRTENVQGSVTVSPNVENKFQSAQINGGRRRILDENLAPPADISQSLGQQSVPSRETVFGLFSVPSKTQQVGLSADVKDSKLKELSPTAQPSHVTLPSQVPFVDQPNSILDRLLASSDLQLEINKSPVKSTSKTPATDASFPPLSLINFQTIPETDGRYNPEGLRALTLSPLTLEGDDDSLREGEPDSTPPPPTVEVVCSVLSTSPSLRGKRSVLRSSGSTTSLKEGAGRRRVTFDPLTLLLDASLEGELDLLKKAIKEV